MRARARARERRRLDCARARLSRPCQLGSLPAGRSGRTHSETGGGGGDSVALLRDALVKDFLPTRTPLLPHIRARSHAHASTQARKRASTQARKHASTQACKHASTLTDTWAGMCACAERRRRLAAVPSFTLISSLSRPSQERRKAAAAAAAATAASTAAAQLPQPPVPPPLLALSDFMRMPQAVPLKLQLMTVRLDTPP